MQSKANLKIRTYLTLLGGALFPSPGKIVILRAVRRLSRRLNPETVLDAGSSHFKYRFLFPNSKYVGLDIDPKAIHRGEMMMKGMPKRWKSTGVVGDISKLDDGLGEFDLVVSLHTLDHLTEAEKANALHGLFKHSRPGGSLIVHGAGLEELVNEISREFDGMAMVNCSSWLTLKMERWWGPRVGERKYLLPQVCSLLFAVGASQFEGNLRQVNDSRLWILEQRRPK